ncbi:hypothetical protein PUMCH_002396 [Australozyma saopauloensis]|uniref:Vesicular-fusion protein SEC18 n=1 Tax=Australozyma saopauloensis TaxID=291208 RepID=A0AAX4H9F8_9ASCO|nr:hypothetical protein PUMCH_002396 [[Candida] saopauloensis]
MEKFGFNRVSNNPSTGGPTISHSRPNEPRSTQYKVALRAANAPSNEVALTNRIAVNPNDFPQLHDGQTVILDGLFVFSISKSPAMEPGTVGLAGHVRQWIRASVGQKITVESYNIATQKPNEDIYLGSIDLLVDFRSSARAREMTVKEEDLVQQFFNSYENQVLQPSQPITMEFRGQILMVTVRQTLPVDIAHLQAPTSASSTDISAKGVLIKEGTDVGFSPADRSLLQIQQSENSRSLEAAPTNQLINSDFKLENLGIGGLDLEFLQIFRRAFASRTVSPTLVEKLGVRHVKGLLLYGPPGTGKTLIARQIGKMLNVKEIQIVNGPEMLSKYVGSSEENIRNLFKNAEADEKSMGKNSPLHIIIFDELDSVFKQRGGGSTGGTGVGDNVVNQLLAKMDGVEPLNNILIIGMTNRLDLIDSALLRPGRFEIQIEISLPDEKGRKEILLIHTKKMADNKLLDSDVNFDELAALTKNYTGAELEGLCNSASSFAIYEQRGEELGKMASNANVKLSRSFFMMALNEVKPAFGIDEDDFKSAYRHGMIEFNPYVRHVFDRLQSYVTEVKTSDSERLVSVLLHGDPGVGKTAIAAKLAMTSGFPLVKMLSAESLVGMSEPQKMVAIDNVMRDIYKSPLNVLVIDKIESLINYVPIGPRFSNEILQMLIVYLKKYPPNGRRLLIIGTTSQYSALDHMNLVENFTAVINLRRLKTFEEINKVFEDLNFMSPAERHEVLRQLEENCTEQLEISVRKLIQIVMNCKSANASVDSVAEKIIESNRF